MPLNRRTDEQNPEGSRVRIIGDNMTVIDANNLFLEEWQAQ